MQSLGEALRDPNRTIRLDGADSVTSQGFVQVPNAALKSTVISPGAKLCYAMLLSYAWHNNSAFPGQERLAKDMGVSLRSANTYIKELEDKTFVSIKRQGQGRPNIYTLHLRVDKLKGGKL
jgi:hypothetical protein